MSRESSSNNYASRTWAKPPHMDEHETRSSTPTLKLKDLVVDTKVDLRLLQSHRLSHVAETGQLTPRTRRIVPTSGDWSHTANFKHTTPEPEAEPETYFPLPPPIATPFTAGLTGSFDEPLLDPPLTAREVSSAQSEHAVATAEKLGHIFSLGEKFPSFSISKETLEFPEPAHSKQSFQHSRRNSQVIRKVNSTFGILQPGTLVSDTVTSSSPIETYKDDSRRHSRRLRKSRPVSGERRRTSFLEFISGNDRHVH
jgi:hypothetical protein